MINIVVTIWSMLLRLESQSSDPSPASGVFRANMSGHNASRGIQSGTWSDMIDALEVAEAAFEEVDQILDAEEATERAATAETAVEASGALPGSVSPVTAPSPSVHSAVDWEEDAQVMANLGGLFYKPAE